MIGSKIRELRREKMWQQKDLANALQMGVGTISNWETGRAKPSKNAIKEMAKLFNVPIDYLTEDGAEKPKDAVQFVCDKCGWSNPDPEHPPRFCPDCGAPFAAADDE